MMQAVIALPAKSGLMASACTALGLARASVYRARTRLLRDLQVRSKISTVQARPRLSDSPACALSLGRADPALSRSVQGRC